MSNYLTVPITNVFSDNALLPNIRGSVQSTTELQVAIRAGNFLEQFPINVVPHPKQDGCYLVWDGSRRLAAARAVGLQEVPVLVSHLEPYDALRRQLAVLLGKDQPVIVLENGEVVAGVCWAVHQLTDARPEEERPSNVLVAAQMGEKPDNISAYRQLFYDDTPGMRERVAVGDIAITVYSRLKHQTREIKIAILEKPGQISRAYVDGFLKRVSTNGLQPVEDRDADDSDDGIEGEPSGKVRFEERFGTAVNATAVLQKIKSDLLRLVHSDYDLNETDFTVIEEIDDLLGELK